MRHRIRIARTVRNTIPRTINRMNRRRKMDHCLLQSDALGRFQSLCHESIFGVSNDCIRRIRRRRGNDSLLSLHSIELSRCRREAQLRPLRICRRWSRRRRRSRPLLRGRLRLWRSESDRSHCAGHRCCNSAVVDEELSRRNQPCERLWRPYRAV